MATVTPESLRQLAAQVRAVCGDVRELAEKQPQDVILGSLAHESVFFCVWAEMAADQLEKALARAD